MTVRELIECSEGLPEDMVVYATEDYGDYCHTQALVELGYPEIIKPTSTAFSGTGLCIPRDGDGDEEEVVVLLA